MVLLLARRQHRVRSQRNGHDGCVVSGAAGLRIRRRALAADHDPLQLLREPDGVVLRKRELWEHERVDAPHDALRLRDEAADSVDVRALRHLAREQAERVRVHVLESPEILPELAGDDVERPGKKQEVQRSGAQRPRRNIPARGDLTRVAVGEMVREGTDRHPDLRRVHLRQDERPRWIDLRAQRRRRPVDREQRHRTLIEVVLRPLEVENADAARRLVGGREQLEACVDQRTPMRERDDLCVTRRYQRAPPLDDVAGKGRLVSRGGEAPATPHLLDELDPVGTISGRPPLDGESIRVAALKQKRRRSERVRGPPWRLRARIEAQKRQHVRDRLRARRVIRDEPEYDALVPGGLKDGVYDHLLDEALAALAEEASRTREVDVADLDPARTPSFAAAHLRPLVERVLASVKGEPDEKQTRRVAILNRLLATLTEAAAEHCSDPPLDDGETRVPAPRHLRLVRSRPALGVAAPMILPETPLAESALLVNAPDEPSLGRELTRELASADRVDLLCAFVKWSGLRFVLDDLAALVARARARGEATPLRVLTTTYIGASDVRAIEELAKLGAEVRISYDDRRTRLHAKAWLFHRESGSHTAYIGSSNLSHAALHEGLEWNVRLAWRDSGPLLDKFRAAFESYWDSDEFEPFDPARDRERVVKALAAQRGADGSGAPALRFDLRPHPYQEPMLEALRVERERGHTRNLLVAPTGTGKTLVAAFDYAGLRTTLPRSRLLFVAHRERILSQSQGAFAAVLRDSGFGGLLTGEAKPASGEHVFATIQSLARMDLARDLPPDHFDVVIVDEFHHAEAPTYDRLLSHVRPRVLLGLTATPERHDGGDVRRWFDGRTAYEMRLWDALEQGLLAPFQYFGAKDPVDLGAVAWRRGWGYDRDELSRLYTGSDARARLVLQELHRRVRDPAQMRALGFCVSVEHARFMARWFEGAGIASVAVTGDTLGPERDAAIQRLEAGKLQALFTVDLFNEGVDIPLVDTVLFLRPTESATVFLQQLGRGLRLHREKPCLTVLDFIGNARQEFRFDRRFRTLLGGTTRQVERQIEAGFPYLPPGCAMQLDPQAQAIVLGNIRRNIGAGQRWLTEELVALGPEATLGQFLREAGVALTELYANKRSFTSLRQLAFGTPALDEEPRALHAGLRAIVHVTDPERLAVLRSLADGSPVPPAGQSVGPPGQPVRPERSVAGGDAESKGGRADRLIEMVAASLLDCRRPADASAALASAREHHTFRAELSQLLNHLEDEVRDLTFPWQHIQPLALSVASAQTTRSRRAPDPVPLHIHARYRQEEVLAAFGVTGEKTGRIPRLQAGVFYVEKENVDLLFVTLKKTDAGFSPSTMYRDYAMSPSRFHWESQNAAHPGSPTGRRYLAKSSTVLLFVRETQEQPNGVAEPYWFLGPVTLESASGERPMQIVWRLAHGMPGHLYQRATVAAG